MDKVFSETVSGMLIIELGMLGEKQVCYLCAIQPPKLNDCLPFERVMNPPTFAQSTGHRLTPTTISSQALSPKLFHFKDKFI